MDYLGKDFYTHEEPATNAYGSQSVRGIVKWDKPKHGRSAGRRVLILRKQPTVLAGASNASGSAGIEAEFQSLVKKWKRETVSMSSPTQMAMHPSYQRIIGFGPVVLPLLIAELMREPDWWFWALRSITGIDPVSDKERGRLAAMTQAWLRWMEIEGAQTDGKSRGAS